MKPILYSTGCPLCSVLKSKLIGADVDFEEINDVKVMEDEGLMSVPGLKVEGKMLNFSDAVKWVNSIEH